jgi:phosphonate transport system substrate-binding protein
LAALAVVAYYIMVQQGEAQEARKSKEEAGKAVMNAVGPRAPRVLNPRFVDADEDLVADVPKDEAKQLDPAVLTFSYVGGDAIGSAGVWKELTDHLAKVTGKKVEYLHAATVDEQLRQLRDGKLMVTVINSGAVPLAVNECGFVPAYTMGDEEYMMDIIVPADSPMQTLEDLRGEHTLTLVEPKSNSGYKVPLLLLAEHGLRVESDFYIRLSMGQKASIAGIASKQYEAAAVASDLLQREVSAGTIKPDQYRVIFHSKPYPQAAVGYAYNLKPDLAAKVRDAFASFAWKGTELEKQFAAGKQGKFAQTRYKENWAEVRKVVDSSAVGYGIKESETAVPTTGGVGVEPVPATGGRR